MNTMSAWTALSCLIAITSFALSCTRATSVPTNPDAASSATASAPTASVAAAAPARSLLPSSKYSPAASFELPNSGGLELDVTNAIPIWVTRDQVVAHDIAVVQLPPKANRARWGVGVTVNRDGVDSMVILALKEAIGRVRQAPIEAVLYVDKSTEFRILMEVLFTLGKCNVTRFVLATERPKDSNSHTVRGWATTSPGHERVSAVTGQWRPVTALVVKAGISIKFDGKNIKPGCAESGQGIAIPKVNDAYDFASLTQCVTQLTKREFEVPIAYLTADPSTPYSEVLYAVQAIGAAGVPAFGFKLPI